MKMGSHEMEKAARIIRNHYGLSRKVTVDEVRAEIANIERRRDAGSLDDGYFRLASALRLL